MTQLIVITLDDLKALEQGKVLDCGEHMQIICAESPYSAVERLNESERAND